MAVNAASIELRETILEIASAAPKTTAAPKPTGHGGDLPAAEGAMQSAKQPDKHRFLATKIIDGDLTLASNRIQHHVWRAISGL